VTTEDSSVEIEDDEEAALHFIVNVSKGDGGEMLEFSCATDGETVEVRNVRYESLSDAEEDDADLLAATYPGPNYDELDETVQEEFHRYLEARGVDHVLANYVAELHVHKEQTLYVDWISKVQGFVGPKE
jgi:complement component 1 Q subcomponent-binding protein